MSEDGATEFRERGYRVVRGLVGRALADRLALHARRLAMKSNGQNTDSQVAGTPAFYGDAAMDTLLAELRPEIEKLSGLELFPTYSYFRVYQPGDALARHLDRPACEISVSLCLGFQGERPWPLWVEGAQGPFGAELEVGDGVLYKGTECPHWREPFAGKMLVQVFLHYVDQHGPHAEWRFDKREALTQLPGGAGLGYSA